MDFTAFTVGILKTLEHFAGSYGMAIVLLTVLVRVVMWPLGVSQQKSMRKMQQLQPKLKELQNRYKNDPKVMQTKMMEFYKEHNFNPFGGCFPLLIQMPIFIMLYSALMSPQFIDIAGKSSFLFINRLDNPIRSHAGKIGSNIFGVEKNDKFSTLKTITVYTDKGAVKDVQIKDPKKAIDNQGEIIPGQPMDLKLNMDQIDLPFNQLDKIQKADVKVFNNGTKEIENVTFTKRDSMLAAQVKTQKAETTFHPDVFVLLILFGITMFFSQKLMSATSSAATDPQQKAMQDQMSNIMPIMITGTFIFVPIPAGALLYMVVSNIIQVIQSFVINKQMDLEEKLHHKPVTEAIPVEAKIVETKKTIK